MKEFFLLLDLETTGLSPEGCQIIEVAAGILPSPDGRYRDVYSSFIKPSHYSHGWETRDWQKEALAIHAKTGLLNQLLKADKDGLSVTIERAEEDILDMIDKNIGSDTLYLMGNSVHFDRSFIKKYMPNLHKRLHYRQLDVTSVRLWFQLFSGKDPLDWDKKVAHRAARDADETLAEAKRYWDRINYFPV